MAAIKVYGFGPRVQPALIAAKYEGVEVQYEEVNPFKGCPAEYLEKFPLGLIPALEHGDFKLTECIAVASYIARENKANLHGKTQEDHAQVLRWMSFANTDVMALYQWFLPLVDSSRPYLKPTVEAAKAKALKSLDFLEKYLADRTFLVSERITLADIHLASVLGPAFATVLDADFRKSHPNVTRHFQTVAHQPQVLEVTGKEPVLCDKAAVYTPPKKEEKPKAAPAPKAEKPKAAPAPADDETPAEPKAKHPCEALGQAKSFPLDEWKRQYSNNETPVAMKWLDEHYDETAAQEYSFCRADFKYNEELTQTFMSANQVTGLHTRLEGSRKYLFGNMLVYGTTNASKIVGVYMFRGSNVEDIFSVAPDWESYEFTPLDYKKDRELIEKVWSWEGKVDGLECADGKTFK
ncbi:hypothetical protein BMF94_0369 [Rhodotorula taiwanensis]|uniref:Glutathione transferase n=1 Tax=Rhodotorula taiwanensis TaxID=741276 RepID=A0A2S5BIB9_9BASI|nr:hypothetical protein BMF94_0369 [Rhodotorula taiwanensis]